MFNIPPKKICKTKSHPLNFYLKNMFPALYPTPIPFEGPKAPRFSALPRGFRHVRTNVQTASQRTRGWPRASKPLVDGGSVELFTWGKAFHHIYI